MTDQQDFETLLPKLGALDRKAVHYPEMPVPQATIEAELMATAARDDCKSLIAAGLDPAKIKELGIAVGALRFTETRMTAALNEFGDAGKQWTKEERTAFTLRADILAAVASGLRYVPEAKDTMNRIREQTGKLGMIQDLCRLAELGRKYPKQLEAVDFDPTLLDMAERKAKTLRSLYARVFIGEKTAEARDMRNRAFTYLRELMGEVMDAAQHAFRRDRIRLQYYGNLHRGRGGRTGSETTVG